MFGLFRKSSNPHDEMLKELARRELRGESVSFSDYLYALDELDDEPEKAATEAEMQEAAGAKERFRSELRRFGLPLKPRHTLCRMLYEKAMAEPSQALLRLLCCILCDDGTLLDTDPAHHTPAEDARNWKRVHQEAEELYAMLSARKQMSVRFFELLDRLKRFRPNLSGNDAGRNPEEAGKSREKQIAMIRKAYRRAFHPKEISDQFSVRVSELLDLADDNADLAAVQPLFLYRVLTIHRSRIQKGMLDLQRMDYRALWKYMNYKIDDDNGKNHRIYTNYLELFGELYQLFATEEAVDIPLCLYGFDRLSNLGEFYRALPDSRKPIPLEPSVEDWLMERMCVFSCYEYGEAENILLEDSGLSVMKLERFQNGKNPRWKQALALVEKEFNRDLETLTLRFLEADPEQVRALCREVLDASALPEDLRPQDETETALFLAAINSGLMESVDNCANDFLMEACRMLTGEYAAQNQMEGTR